MKASHWREIWWLEIYSWLNVRTEWCGCIVSWKGRAKKKYLYWMTIKNTISTLRWRDPFSSSFRVSEMVVKVPRRGYGTWNRGVGSGKILPDSFVGHGKRNHHFGRGYGFEITLLPMSNTRQSLLSSRYQKQETNFWASSIVANLPLWSCLYLEYS